MKRIFLTAVLCCAVLCCAVQAGQVLDENMNVKCGHSGVEDFKRSLKDATFIVMGKMVENLPNNMGKYKVSIVFKGDFKIGNAFQHSVLWPLSPAYKDEIGKHYIFWGKEIDVSTSPVTLRTDECKGKSAAISNYKDGQIPVITSIVKQIVTGEIK